MIALSTSLFEGLSGDEMANRASDLGFSFVEINFRLNEKQTKDLIRAASKLNISISSLHNFVPEPPEGERSFMLSDLDESLRKKAVELTVDTILLAEDIGAAAVVLHLGQPREWDYKTPQVELRQAIHANADYNIIEDLKNNLIEGRKRLPSLYLDSILTSLDKVVNATSNTNVKLGVENRYFYGQFPSHEEIGIILQEFSGSNIGYWHDCGHGAHDEYCGLSESLKNLNIFKDRLVGIHLHDINDWYDHQLPSSGGKVNFNDVSKSLSDNHVKVLEPGPWVNQSKITEALQYLNSAGIA